MDIRIFINTDASPFKPDRCRAAYRIEVSREGKDPATKEDSFALEEATQNGATLEALNTALSALKDGMSLSVTVICPAPHIICSINQRQYETWKANGWKNAKGQPVKNLDEWQRTTDLIEKKLHSIIAQAPEAEDVETMNSLGAGYFLPEVKLNL